MSSRLGAAPLRNPGVGAALGAALLFGAGTPLAKALLAGVGPWLLAGLLYVGAGVGLWHNNLTRRVSFVDATWVAMVKGLVAGSVNIALAVLLGATWPGAVVVSGALLVGALSYGASLALFVVGLRMLGTARTGAYFSVAPFFGAALAVALLGEPITVPLLVAGLLMAVGVWLHPH